MQGPATDVVRVPLVNGGFALVDASDYPRALAGRWWRMDRRRKDGTVASYARGRVGGEMTWMHRFILGTPDGLVTDHENGNGLDNRRQNLRACTQQHNLANQAKTRGTSRYKGVSFHKRAQKWHAEIVKDGRRVHSSLHLTEESAARAYDLKAAELFGEFARLNFPVEVLA